MSDARLIHRKLKLLNSSDGDLEVWLEWDVPIRYLVGPMREFFVHGLAREAHVDHGVSPDWEVSVDVANNSVVVYMPDELLLIEDFYLTDAVSSHRIEPTEH